MHYSNCITGYLWFESTPPLFRASWRHFAKPWIRAGCPAGGALAECHHACHQAKFVLKCSKMKISAPFQTQPSVSPGVHSRSLCTPLKPIRLQPVTFKEEVLVTGVIAEPVSPFQALFLVFRTASCTVVPLITFPPKPIPTLEPPPPPTREGWNWRCGFFLLAGGMFCLSKIITMIPARLHFS